MVLALRQIHVDDYDDDADDDDDDDDET